MKYDSMAAAASFMPDVGRADDPSGTFVLGTWRAVSSGEVRKLVMESPAKSCSLDPMPTYVFRDCLDALLPFLTALINSGQVHLCEVWHDEAPWIKIPSALPTCSLLQPC